MARRKRPASTNIHSIYAGWCMAWIALVMVGVGLLALLKVPILLTSLIAFSLGAPIALVLSAAIEMASAQTIVLIFALVALYGFLAWRMIQQSGFALSCGLFLVLLDLGLGILGCLRIAAMASYLWVVFLLAFPFLIFRLNLIHQINQGLQASDSPRFFRRLGASSIGLMAIVVDPIAWIFYSLAGSNQSPDGQRSSGRQQASDRNHRGQG
jgi:hypothetical protein